MPVILVSSADGANLDEPGASAARDMPAPLAPAPAMRATRGPSGMARGILRWLRMYLLLWFAGLALYLLLAAGAIFAGHLWLWD